MIINFNAITNAITVYHDMCHLWNFTKKEKEKTYQILKFGIQIYITNITKINLFYACSSLIADLHEL